MGSAASAEAAQVVHYEKVPGIIVLSIAAMSEENRAKFLAAIDGTTSPSCIMDNGASDKTALVVHYAPWHGVIVLRIAAMSEENRVECLAAVKDWKPKIEITEDQILWEIQQQKMLINPDVGQEAGVIPFFVNKKSYIEYGILDAFAPVEGKLFAGRHAVRPYVVINKAWAKKSSFDWGDLSSEFHSSNPGAKLVQAFPRDEFLILGDPDSVYKPDGEDCGTFTCLVSTGEMFDTMMARIEEARAKVVTAFNNKRDGVKLR